MKLPALMSQMVARPEQVIKQATAIFHMRADVEASDELMQRIAGLLRHNPKEWLYLYNDHPLRARAEAGLKDYIADPSTAIILVHPHEKWCIVAQDDLVYPVIFKSSVMDTHLFKIVGGKGSRWLLTMLNDMINILETQNYTDGDTAHELSQLSQLSQLDIKNDPVARLTGAGFRL
jgi:hypothetical protein